MTILIEQQEHQPEFGVEGGGGKEVVVDEKELVLDGGFLVPHTNSFGQTFSENNSGGLFHRHGRHVEECGDPVAGPGENVSDSGRSSSFKNGRLNSFSTSSAGSSSFKSEDEAPEVWTATEKMETGGVDESFAFSSDGTLRDIEPGEDPDLELGQDPVDPEPGDLSPQPEAEAGAEPAVPNWEWSWFFEEAMRADNLSTLVVDGGIQHLETTFNADLRRLGLILPFTILVAAIVSLVLSLRSGQKITRPGWMEVIAVGITQLVNLGMSFVNLSIIYMIAVKITLAYFLSIMKKFASKRQEKPAK